jgi:hypothetical protein
VPLLPIDLQTLFGQSTQVGREQNAQREGVPLAQSVQGATIARQAAAKDAAVNETRQQDEGPEQARIRDRRRRRRGTGADARANERRPPEPAPKPAETEIARDPALGRNVDITG